MSKFDVQLYLGLVVLVLILWMYKWQWHQLRTSSQSLCRKFVLDKWEINLSYIHKFEATTWVVSAGERGNYCLQVCLSFIQCKISDVVCSPGVSNLSWFDTKTSFENSQLVYTMYGIQCHLLFGVTHRYNYLSRM